MDPNNPVKMLRDAAGLTACSTATSPSCVPFNQTVLVGQFELAPYGQTGSSQTFTVVAFATGAQAGSTPSACSVTGTVTPLARNDSYYPQLVRQAKPSAYYRLDEATGSTTTTDSSDTTPAKNGTYHGAVTFGAAGALRRWR